MPRFIARNILRFVLPMALHCLQGTSLFAGVNCEVVKPHPPSEAEKAFLAADYAKAASEYQTALASPPGDAELTAGLVRALLRQQKVQEAADAVKASLAVAPNSAALISLRGEVEFRQGTPWLASQSAVESDKLDPCNPRNHLLMASLERISSLYASNRKELEIAHRLDPGDPDIRREWIRTLPLKQGIAEAEAYLSAPTGIDEEDARHLKMNLERLKKMAAEPRKPCRLVSSLTTAEIPFEKIMSDATHVRAYGLDVKLNGRPSLLQIDTGAGGLLVARSVAERAGLKPLAETETGGIGDQGYRPGYSAYADSIHIGSLEFQNCQVEVLDSRSVLNGDGLIGMDVFAQFLVTLDYPMHKLVLGQLPPRPGESMAQAPSLKTSEAVRDEDEESETPSKGAEQNGPIAAQSALAGTAPTPETRNPDSVERAVKGPSDRYIAPEMKDYTKVYRVGHDLILPAALNGKEIRLFIMDTGAYSTSISPAAAREVTKVHADDLRRVKGINGEVKDVYWADSVTFRFAQLSQTVPNVVSFDTSRISRGTGMEISGLIGATALNLLTIHIDYRDGLLKFDYDPSRGYKF
jgi:predicted aspartyl protease/Flp pilus assembly protein TadD